MTRWGTRVDNATHGWSQLKWFVNPNYEGIVWDTGKAKGWGEWHLTYNVQSRIWPQSDFSLPDRLTTSLPERPRREVLRAGKDGGDREERRTGTRISGEK